MSNTEPVGCVAALTDVVIQTILDGDCSWASLGGIDTTSDQTLIVKCPIDTCSKSWEGSLEEVTHSLRVHASKRHQNPDQRSDAKFLLASREWYDFISTWAVSYCAGCGRGYKLDNGRTHNCAGLGPGKKRIKSLHQATCFSPIPDMINSPPDLESSISDNNINDINNNNNIIDVQTSSSPGCTIFSEIEIQNFSNDFPISISPSNNDIPLLNIINLYSNNYILYNKIPTIDLIPRNGRGPFIKCFYKICDYILQNPVEVWRWNLLFYFPIMCLKKDLQPYQIVKRLDLFSKGLFMDLFNILQSDKLPIAKKKRNIKPKSESLKFSSVKRLITKGYATKAMEELRGREVSEIGVHEFEALESLHPEGTWSIREEDYIPYHKSVEVTVDDVHKCIKRMPRGKCGGVDGWLFEHFRVLLEGEHVLVGFTSVINLILAGRLPDEVAEIFKASSLTGIPKPNKGIRPIAMGNALKKLVGKAVALRMDKEIQSLFPHSQYGVGMRCGTDQVVHTIRRAYNKGQHIMTLDIKNAYNTISRGFLYQMVVEKIPSLLPYFVLIYGTPSLLMVSTEGGMAALLSREGVQQGCPLSSFLFCLGIQGILEEVESISTSSSSSSPFPDSTNASYADDMNFGRISIPQLSNVYVHIKKALPRIHLELRPDKCKILLAQGSEEVRDSDFGGDQLQIVREGVVICGAPIGSLEFKIDFFNKKKEDLVSDLELLKDYGRETGRWLDSLYLFRLCITSAYNYLARVCPPDEVTETFFFDVSIELRSFLATFLHTSLLFISDLPFLPPSHGGLGLKDPSLYHDLAYYASLSECLSRYEGGSWDEIVCYSDYFPAELIPLNKPSIPLEKLQSKLTSLREDALLKKFLDGLDGPERATIIGGAQVETSKWIFTNSNSRLTEREYLICACIRLLIPLPYGLQDLFDTNLSSKFNIVSQVLGNCLGGGVIGRHNRFEDVFIRTFSKCGFFISKEPIVRVNESNNDDGVAVERADLVLHKPGRKSIYIDFFFVTGSSSSLNKNVTFKYPDRVFTKGRHKKIKHYRDMINKDLDGIFLPFGLEVMGRLDSKLFAPIKGWLEGLSSEVVSEVWLDLSIELARMRAWTLERFISTVKVIDNNLELSY